MRIALLNGPNLNLIGKREPEIYGDQSLEAYVQSLASAYPEDQISYHQSNEEGVLISLLHTVAADVIVLNAGALTHTSIALADAIGAINTPVIEVHISNVFKREVFRHHSYISAKAAGTISGFGLSGYRLAIEAAKAL
jgi:3-dehydroquinate dehydratase-2